MVGCGGEPTFGASGPFRVGEKLKLRGRGLPPFSVALMYVAVNEANLPDLFWEGTSVLLWPPKFVKSFFTGGDPAVPGSGSFFLFYTIQPDIVAAGKIYYQAIALDSCAPDGVVSTNGYFLGYQEEIRGRASRVRLVRAWPRLSTRLNAALPSAGAGRVPNPLRIRPAR